MARRGYSRSSAAWLWALRIGALAVVWLALSDSRNRQELLVGAVAVALAAGATALLARPRPSDTLARMAAPARVGLRRCAGPVWKLVRDSAVVSWVALRSAARLRRPHGSFRATRYRPGEARRGVGGRILTEGIGSFAPNRYVVGVDEEAGLILVHELDPSEDPIDPFAR